MKRTALIFLFVITFQFVFAQKRLSFAERLNTLEGVEVEVIPSFDSLYQTFKISIEQPIDHNNPEDGVFLQKI